MRTRRAIPSVIANAPELWPSLSLFVTAFWDLSTDRHIGPNLGPIPWTAVSHYADVHGYDVELREDLHALIREMDLVYLDFRNKKATDS